MCGIFGAAILDRGSLPDHAITSLLRELFLLSESRGKESCGLHAFAPDREAAIQLRAARPASWLVRGPALGEATAFLESTVAAGSPVCVIAHSRLVTNGSSARPENNQPVPYGDVRMIHNGIVVNVDELWARHPHLRRSAEVDTEVIAAMVAEALDRGCDPLESTRIAYRHLAGAASIAWLHHRLPALTVATNTGDLFTAEPALARGMVFASERHILVEATRRAGWTLADGVRAMPAGSARCIELGPDRRDVAFRLSVGSGDERKPSMPIARAKRVPRETDLSPTAPAAPVPITRVADESLLRYDRESLGRLRRCACCVLPDTFPFIDFDSAGICNYCRNYRPKYRGTDPNAALATFAALVDRYRRQDGEPEVLVPFSGGRDSCYGLHLIVQELGLRPVTFTYDWGMVTDLARRNIARMCGKLGIPNILVSADLAAKRANIRANVSAWLRQPDLGMVPLFMAGDKHFFRIVNRLKRETGIRLDLWSANPLENTDFKSGFCGVPPDFGKERLDYLSLGRQAKMAGYYALRFLTNPCYLNRSLVDTASAFLSYYREPRRDFFFMFSHLVWNEDAVNRTILERYDFEMSPDSPSTWRIGDGTAPFYNYIYVTARGFSEFDTFRSNQIREGQIGREEALARVLDENHPRTEGLRWYLEAIGLDFNAVIRRINELDIMGLHR